MPLPNDIGIPASARMRQEGFDPIKDIPVGAHHPNAAKESPQIADMKRSVESRLSSILSPSNFIQSGLFGALGNNPATQAIAGIGGAAGDVWNSLMMSPEEKKAAEEAKNPAQILHKHTGILTDILHAIYDTNDILKHWVHKVAKDDDDEFGNYKPAARSGKHVKKGNKGPDLPDPRNHKEPDYGHHPNRDAWEAMKAADDPFAVTPESLARVRKEFNDLRQQEADKARAKFDPDKTIHTTRDALESQATKDVWEANQPYDPDKRIHTTVDRIQKKEQKREEPKREEPKRDFLASMLDKLGFKKASNVMDNFSKSMIKVTKKMVETFSDVSKTIKAKSKPLVDAIKKSQTAEYLGKSKQLLKNGFEVAKKKSQPFLTALKKSQTAEYLGIGKKKVADLAKKIGPTFKEKMAGFTQKMSATPAASNIRASISNVAKGPVGGIVGAGAVGAAKATAPPESPEAQPAAEESSSVIDTATQAAGAWQAGKWLKGGASKVAGWFGKGVKGAAGLAKGAAVPAAVAYGVANATDWGAGKLGVGKGSEGNDSKLDEAQDDKNWDKMSAFEKLESSAARGIEKAGSFVGLSNFAREAGAKRIKNESEYLQAKSGQAHGVDQIERLSPRAVRAPTISKAKTIHESKDRADELKNTKSQDTSTGTVIGAINNNNNSNTTIMPTRSTVRNEDASFNRYLNTALSY